MKKLKAFTLVELIVSMAIFGIIMAAVMQMIQPISNSSVTAKITNEQKNVENSIATYIGENVRYATNLVIVKGGNFQNAVNQFVNSNPLDIYGQEIPYTSRPELKKDIIVICFDGTSTYKFIDADTDPANQYKGRLLRSKNDAASYNIADLPMNNYPDACSPTDVGAVYEVFGNAYYSHADYYLKAEFSDNALKLTVDSDYFYTPGAKKRTAGERCSTSSANPIVGYYELRNKTSGYPFVFKMVDSGGAEITDPTLVPVSNRVTGEQIYFVYTLGEKE